MRRRRRAARVRRPARSPSVVGTVSTPCRHRAHPAERYVGYVYESLLFRSPDAAGLRYWAAVVDRGGRNAFVNSVVSSQEWRATWINAF